jgi:hypothetical protein
MCREGSILKFAATAVSRVCLVLSTTFLSFALHCSVSSTNQDVMYAEGSFTLREMG